MKLDRLIARHEFMGRRAAHERIAAGRVQVNGQVIRDGQWEVDRFGEVRLDGLVIQAAERALYLMMHKPAGWLSATEDAALPTVMDLIDDPDKSTLHLAGRLDRSTSGLLLLTNDGRWSKALMNPDAKVPKVYEVETAEDIAPEAVAAFAQGFYFHTEDITTRPAKLILLAPRRARLTLHEGRYHQVKRMFHRVQNRVVGLHRTQIGGLALPPDLAPGQWRALSPAERAAACAPE